MSTQKYPQGEKRSDSTTGKRPIKENGYKSAVLHQKRDKKRQAAASRQRYYDGLSIQKRLDLAKSRRGESKREIARLEKALKVPKTQPSKS